jgi:GPH family glycoside/pentoside/hexuronide:cation symporter
LMMSMTADVIDMDELNTGLRREGIFGAIYWWMVKFGFAIAGGLSGVILSVVGFNADLGQQTLETLTGLRLFYSGVPIGGTLIALLVMWDYDVTEEKANEIREQLDKRKEPKKQGSSYYSVDKLSSYVPGSAHALATDEDFTSKSSDDIRSLFLDSLKSGLHGLSFSPYLEGQNVGDQLTETQIRQRMEIIAPYTQWVRSFSCIDGNEFIPRVAHESGLKVMAGAWIGEERDQNEKEIAGLIELAKAGFVDVAAVGNEVMLRGDLTKKELINYIRRVKEAIPDIPVGSVEPYFLFHEHADFVESCDVILANCYPFWEGSSVEHATGYLHHMHEITQKAAKGKPVLIAETGWPTKGEVVSHAQPSIDNAMKYFVNVNNWRKENQTEVFYFSSFDESWKIRHEGDTGQSWGIWDKNGKLK